MIRKANLSDLDVIYDLYQSVNLDRAQMSDPDYAFHVQKRGFLLGLDEKLDIETLIRTAPLFLVSEDEQVNGYIVAEQDSKYLDDEYKTWFDDDLKKIYFNASATMSVHTLAVHPNNHHQGVALKLHTAFIEQLRAQGVQYLFSIVTLGPLTNCASLLFHTRNGFQRLAMAKPRELFGFSDYTSVLFYKKL